MSIYPTVFKKSEWKLSERNAMQSKSTSVSVLRPSLRSGFNFVNSAQEAHYLHFLPKCPVAKAGFYIKPEIGWQVTISSYVVIHNEILRFALADFRECKLSPLVQILHPINNTMGTLQKCQVSSDRPGID